MQFTHWSRECLEQSNLELHWPKWLDLYSPQNLQAWFWKSHVVITLGVAELLPFSTPRWVHKIALLDPTTLAEVQPYCAAQEAKHSWTLEDVLLQICAIAITVFSEVRIRMWNQIRSGAEHVMNNWITVVDDNTDQTYGQTVWTI